MRALERVVDETLARRTPAEVVLGRKQWPSVRVALCGNGFDIMFAKALGLDVRCIALPRIPVLLAFLREFG